MTRENKELLLKDLCARLSYGVKVRYSSYYEFITCTLDTVTPKYKCVDLWSKNACFTSIFVDKIKPYLFPLSSMTDEQKEELKQRGWYFDCFEIYNVDKHGWREAISHEDCFDLIDWLNKNHIDFRGLIEKGLAIDATGLNIY